MDNLTTKELKVIAKEKGIEFKNNATQKDMLELLTPRQEPLMLRVMDRGIKKVIIIDGSIEKDWKTKYLHPTGKEFI